MILFASLRFCFFGLRLNVIHADGDIRILSELDDSTDVEEELFDEEEVEDDDDDD